MREQVETSENSYIRAASMLRLVAEQVTELEVPDEVIEKWRTLFICMRTIDGRLDAIGDPLERKQFSTRLLSFLQGGSENFEDDNELTQATITVKGLIDDLPTEKRDFFISALNKIVRVTENIKLEENPTRFSTLTRLEGQIVIRLFTPFLPQQFIENEHYGALIKSLTRIARAGNSLDSFLDLPQDHAAGQAKVSPTLFNRAILLGAVLTDSISFLRHAGLSKKVIGRGSREIERVIKNNLGS